jgi:hypothetical protein
VDGELQRLAGQGAEGDIAAQAAHDPAQRGTW